MEPDRKAALKLSILYAAVFSFIGVYLPYWPVWLESLELSPMRIAVLMGIAPWARAIANPVAGWLAARRIPAPRLLLLLATSSTFGYASFLVADGFAALFLMMLLVGFVHAPIVPLVDSITLRAKVSYGRVRLWGSASFILASLAAGWFLEDRSASLVLWLILGCCAAVALCTLMIQSRTEPPARDKVRRAEPMLAVLGRPGFKTFLLACALLQASHSMLYVFGTLHWLDAGVEESTIGILWSVGVVAEIALFFLAGRFSNRLRPSHWLLLAALGGIVRWSVLASTTELAPVFLAQSLHALTFGAMHLGAMAFIRENIPDEQLSSGTTLYSATSAGLAFGLAIPAVGMAYEALGGCAYWVMAGLSVISLGVVVLLLRRPRQR